MSIALCNPHTPSASYGLFALVRISNVSHCPAEKNSQFFVFLHLIWSGQFRLLLEAQSRLVQRHSDAPELDRYEENRWRRPSAREESCNLHRAHSFLRLLTLHNTRTDYEPKDQSYGLKHFISWTPQKFDEVGYAFSLLLVII